MDSAAVDELNAVESWAGTLLAQLTPAARRAAMRDIALELRRSQQRRIAAQQNPDGSAYEPRKAKPVAKKAREKRGRIKRRAMFAKLRATRWLKVETETDGFAIGFTGRVARIARVHQFGDQASVALGGPEYHYPARVLLGLTSVDREAIRDRILLRIASMYGEN